MLKSPQGLLFSATDVINYLDCPHCTVLDMIDLETPLPKTEDSDEARLVQTKGIEHEQRFLDRLRKQGNQVFEVTNAANLEAKVRETIRAMQSGVDVVYQAALMEGSFLGHADFLRKTNPSSSLGAYSYEVLDTKLALSAKTKFVAQLAFYSELLARVQGRMPHMMHVVLGDQTEKSFACAQFSRYVANVVRRFQEHARSLAPQIQPGMDAAVSLGTYPDPCPRCLLCKWQALCEERRLNDDHLCQVAGINRMQIKRLHTAGVSTLEALGKWPVGKRMPKIAGPTLDKLVRQAALQLKARETGQQHYELLSPSQEDGPRGFARLPKPCPGDMFFDMEGDPLEEGGLEYLFGLYVFDQDTGRKAKGVGKEKSGATATFIPFWGHDRAGEKRAFEQFMDYVTNRLRQYPDAYIYHYAHYEPAALKKLMSLHGTREVEVDNLLRAGKLVDLYKVVREALRVSEPSYSIKNIEHFYLGRRTGDVQSAGASIVFYERWKETNDPELLEKIEDYNKEDVRSTHALREWLLSLRPLDTTWFSPDMASGESAQKTAELTEHEQRIAKYRTLLVDGLPPDRQDWDQRAHVRELTWQLLDFFRRSAKPAWWGMFARQDMTEEERIEDMECIGSLVRDRHRAPVKEKQSFVYAYRFPEQETKLKSGDNVTILGMNAPLREFEMDQDALRVTFKMAVKHGEPPDRISIGAGGPINTNKLREAVFRFADSLLTGDDNYQAIHDLLNRSAPRIKDHVPGNAIIDESVPALPQISEAVAGLQNSCIFVQGPPGSGKTYTGSRVIADLLRLGKTVGVSSNSHKAIHNLLQDVEQVALETNFAFAGVKKSNRDAPETHFNGRFIQDVFANDEVAPGQHQLVAGTAWLFSDPGLDQSLDYLFVDEAGQVALAYLIAMGVSARNIVLLGDQMQLGQPIQGVHPGRSGESSLECLLGETATIPPDQGIFLKTTWRMHPDVCRLISDMVYDARLEPEPHTINQVLLLNKDAHPALTPTGVRFVPVHHDACSQQSEEEADLIRELVESLLQQRYQDKGRQVRPITLENILVVAPYNMQVNLLQRVLPAGARVGTVDKFQGQQAEVVIVSMTTSNEESLPRFIDFLYSKNRLNVALSRAKSLALLVANPELMSIKCSTPEQMALVNVLCWVWEYSGSKGKMRCPSW
ncbi:MAG TPA: TM0106 family RecB-like putative nuclease [Desulfonatronum sp.]|nr:TM0106 family RecB-like putative nuclease [Desulfonatronum sp.]